MARIRLSKKEGKNHQSDPLLPDRLEKKKDRLKPEYYNWLYLSVWLGLRPMEIDYLTNKENTRLQKAPDGTLILWIYQTKLTSVPPRYRWKLIPLIFKEQNHPSAEL